MQEQDWLELITEEIKHDEGPTVADLCDAIGPHLTERDVDRWYDHYNIEPTNNVCALWWALETVFGRQVELHVWADMSTGQDAGYIDLPDLSDSEVRAVR